MGDPRFQLHFTNDLNFSPYMSLLGSGYGNGIKVENLTLSDKATEKLGEAAVESAKSRGRALDRVFGKDGLIDQQIAGKNTERWMNFGGAALGAVGDAIIDGMKLNLQRHYIDKTAEVEDKKITAAVTVATDQQKTAREVNKTREVVSLRAISGQETIAREQRLMQVAQAKIAGRTAENISRTQQIGLAFKSYFAGNPYVA